MEEVNTHIMSPLFNEPLIRLQRNRSVPGRDIRTHIRDALNRPGAEDRVRRLTSGGVMIVKYNRGPPQVDASSLKTVAGGMMEAGVVAFFSRKCIDHSRGTGVVPPQLTQRMIGQERARNSPEHGPIIDLVSGEDDSDEDDKPLPPTKRLKFNPSRAEEAVRNLRHVEKSVRSDDLFEMLQLHLLRLSAGHYSLMSILKVPDQGYHMFVHCSRGGAERWDDQNKASLLFGLGLFYESKHGPGSFNVTKWRSPAGRGSRRCSIQNGGTDCGAYMAYNIESMVRYDAPYPEISDQDITLYRKYMAMKMMDVVEASGEYTLRHCTKVKDNGGL